MGKKFGGNTKADEARERKRQQEEEKATKARAKTEAAEQEKWKVGAKSNDKKLKEEQQRQERLDKKQERLRLEAAEAAELSKYKQPKGPKEPPTAVRKGSSGLGSSVSSLNSSRGSVVIRTGSASIGGDSSDLDFSSASASSPSSYYASPIQEYSASNIDDALSLLASTTGTARPEASTLDRHPERRVKAAFAAWSERESLRIRAESPGLRHSQVRERLAKAWVKAPENPFNQAHIAHNLSRDEEVAILADLDKALHDRLRIN